MKKKLMLMLLVALSLFQNLSAQKSYYYYQGAKNPIERLDDKFSVISFNDSQDALLQTKELNGLKEKDHKNSRYRITVLKSSEKLRVLLDDFMKKGLIVQPCYKNKDGLELIPSIDINVKLKQAKDFDLLKEYVRKNDMLIIKQYKNMPLWYLVAIKKSKVLEQANKMYETGLFASASPNFISDARESISEIAEEEPNISFRFNPSYATNEGQKVRNNLRFSIKAEGKLKIISSGLNNVDAWENGKTIAYEFTSHEPNRKAFDIKVYGYVTEVSITDEVIDEVKISNCPSLERLELIYLPLKRLDCSNNLKLKSIKCNNLVLSELKLPKTSSLTHLDCSNSSLERLSLEGLENLKVLKCGGNKLTSLDVSANKNLEVLMFAYNQIKAMDLVTLKGLKTLDLSNNPIVNVDFSKLQNLSTLFCSGTLMKQMDISALKNLEQLIAKKNKALKSIVFSKNGQKTEKLKIAELRENALEELDFSGLEQIYTISCERNRLRNGACARMVKSLPNYAYPSMMLNNKIRIIDTSYGNGNLCYEEDVLLANKKNWECYDFNGVEETEFRGLRSTALDERHRNLRVSVYPNPAKDFAFVEGLQAKEEIKVYSMDGALLLTITADNFGKARLELKNLANGFYVIKTDRASIKLEVKQ